MDKEIVVNSLKYMDLNNEKYARVYDKFVYYSYIDKQSDIEHNIIQLYDKDMKQFFSSRYEVMGMYIKNFQLWTWSWSIPDLTKNKIFLSKKLLNYGLDLTQKELPFLKSELITSRFRVTDEIQLDIHTAMASYISKTPMILRLIFDPFANKVNDLFLNIKESKPNTTVFYLFLLDEPTS